LLLVGSGIILKPVYFKSPVPAILYANEQLITIVGYQLPAVKLENEVKTNLTIRHVAAAYQLAALRLLVIYLLT
jgi:hypothetical protein